LCGGGAGAGDETARSIKPASDLVGVAAGAGERSQLCLCAQSFRA
jgi:hypothetical protein